MTGSSGPTPAHAPAARRAPRPAHPPFTHFPLAAYVFAAAFDLSSAVAGGQHRWATQLWHAATFLLVGGLAICLVTMGTGFWDLVRFWPRAQSAAPTVAAHVCLMGAVFMIGAGDIAWRLGDYGTRAATPPGLATLSLAAAVAACTGAHFGGRLVFGHGVGVAGLTGLAGLAGLARRRQCGPSRRRRRDRAGAQTIPRRPG